MLLYFTKVLLLQCNCNHGLNSYISSNCNLKPSIGFVKVRLSSFKLSLRELLQRLQQLRPFPPPPGAALALQGEFHRTRHLFGRRGVVVLGAGGAVDDGEGSDGVLLAPCGGLGHHGDHDGDGEGVGAELLGAFGERAHELEGSEGALGGGAVEVGGGLHDGGDGAGLDGDAAVGVGEAEGEEDLGGGLGLGEVGGEGAHEVGRARRLLLGRIGDKRTF